MNKLVLFFAGFLCLATSANAQTSVYHPFPDTTSIWSVDDYNIITYAKTHTRLGLKGDTVINAMNYKKIYSIWYWDTTMITSYNTYYAALREQNKKIYTKIGNQPEQVLYDFNLAVGDTMHYYYSLIESQPDTFSRVLTKIDSFKLYTGEYRKRYCFANGINCYVPDTVVEGIGSIYWWGLFNPLVNNMCTCGDEYTFSCFKEMDTVLYLNNTFCSYCFCGLSVDLNEFQSLGKITVFPNPATDKLFIETFQNSSIEISNIEGQILQSFITKENNTTLDISSLAKGIYFIKVINENGIATEKFIKE